VKRTILRFSLRCAQTMSEEDMVRRLGPALGCTFAEREFREIPAWRADLLGLGVYLYEWGGIDRRAIFRLHTALEDEGYLPPRPDVAVDFVDLDISTAIVDLLQVRGAGDWWIPSAEEIAAEQAYGRDFARYMREGLDFGDEDDEDDED
jgi:hypothetical protein